MREDEDLLLPEACDPFALAFGLAFGFLEASSVGTEAVRLDMVVFFNTTAGATTFCIPAVTTAFFSIFSYSVSKGRRRKRAAIIA